MMTERELLERVEQQAVTIAELRRSVVYLTEQIERLPTVIRDRLIDEMRKTAVNCGAHSSCAVAGWLKKSSEI